MKKSVLLFYIFLCLGLSSMSQTNHIDTIEILNWNPDNYFLNWDPLDSIPENFKDSVIFSKGGIGMISSHWEDTMDVATFDYHTDDTVLIDGLAIALGFIFDPAEWIPLRQYGILSVIDTTLDSCYTHAVIYQSRGDSMQLLASGYVHIANTPVAYYLKTSEDLHYGSVPIFEVPITEVAVFDTFFVGVTIDQTYNKDTIPGTNIELNHHWPLKYYAITDDTYNNTYNNGYPARIMRLHYEMRPAWEQRTIYEFPLMFAILSEHQPGDSNRTAIETCERLDAVTTVSPSLASEVVIVQCGFNMSNVEVYDMQGRLIASKRHAGHLTQFNVGAWPEGVYVMRISTMAGITTQRVVVTR